MKGASEILSKRVHAHVVVSKDAGGHGGHDEEVETARSTNWRATHF